MITTSLNIWNKIQISANRILVKEAALASFAQHIVFSNETMAKGLGHLLVYQQLDMLVSREELSELFISIYDKVPEIVDYAIADLKAFIAGDPAATDYLIPFLFYKGFHALQTHRVAHVLWQEERQDMAFFLQNRSSVLYGVDIHPAAKIGQGIMFDHATGIVIGETAIVEDGVSIFHGATLGGRGTERGDRHPKVRRGAMIGAGATILGNTEIGYNATVGAGSVVLKDVPPHTTVVGVPAVPVSD